MIYDELGKLKPKAVKRQDSCSTGVSACCVARSFCLITEVVKH
jgi:hypothetical protein